MVRFVDLRNQDIEHGFAFWDTVRDVFEQYGGCFAWQTWAEFEEDYTGEGCGKSELKRHRSLCPDWVFKPYVSQTHLSEDPDFRDTLALLLYHVANEVLLDCEGVSLAKNIELKNLEDPEDDWAPFFLKRVDEFLSSLPQN